MAHRHVRACLITNPRSGRGGVDLGEPLAILDAHGWEVDVRQKLHGGAATDLARDAVRDGYDVVVGCGGDGTLSEIVAGVVGTDAAVGVLPGGTENLWAREVGISSRLSVAALQLVSGERRRVDVGQMAINGGHGQPFLQMVGLGLDGAVVARVSKPLKNRIGRAAVGLAALRALPTFRTVPVRVEMDGVQWEGHVSQIVVGNTRRYGGFTRITADAYIDDGQLDVCLITAGDPGSAGRQLATLLLRQRPSAATAESFRAASITIHAPTALPVQLDGGAVSPKRLKSTEEGVTYTFSVVAQGVCVLLPRTYDNGLFLHDAFDDALSRGVMHSQEAAGPHGKHQDTHAGRHGGKTGGRLMRIVAVGVDTLTAAHARTGRVYTVELGPRTTIANGAGPHQPLPHALATLAEGDVVRVKGKKGKRQQGTIAARRITLVGPMG